VLTVLVRVFVNGEISVVRVHVVEILVVSPIFITYI